jgi:molybdate transport system substrate-binding protein
MLNPTKTQALSHHRMLDATSLATEHNQKPEETMKPQKFLALTMACGIALSSAAHATDLIVVSSGGVSAAYKELAPGFEKATGDKLITGWGPSMGTTHDAVPMRIQRGEKIDVVIMVGYALGQLIDQGKVLPDSRIDLARSRIGAAVKAGAPHPDISTVEGLKQALLNAKSIAYSDSASGVYIQTTMFKKMGIEAAVAARSHMIPATPVGEIIAKGDADIGFQQISELKPVPGIDVLGPIPDAVQQVTIFSGGVLANSEHVKQAEALLAYLHSPQSAPVMRETGLDPM